MTTLDEFLLLAPFKGELPPELEDFNSAHWGLLARTMHALGDAEEKSEATSLLTGEVSSRTTSSSTNCSASGARSYLVRVNSLIR